MCSKTTAMPWRPSRAVNDFLETYRPHDQRCLLVDAQLPGMSGIDLIQRLREMGDPIPAVVVSGHADVPMAVRAMKVGAVDFLEMPVGRDELLASVQRALDSFEEIARITEFLNYRPFGWQA